MPQAKVCVQFVITSKLFNQLSDRIKILDGAEPCPLSQTGVIKFARQHPYRSLRTIFIHQVDVENRLALIDQLQQIV